MFSASEELRKKREQLLNYALREYLATHDVPRSRSDDWYSPFGEEDTPISPEEVRISNLEEKKREALRASPIGIKKDIDPPLQVKPTFPPVGMGGAHGSMNRYRMINDPKAHAALDLVGGLASADLAGNLDYINLTRPKEVSHDLVADTTFEGSMPLIYSAKEGHPFDRPGNEWMKGSGRPITLDEKTIAKLKERPFEIDASLESEEPNPLGVGEHGDYAAYGPPPQTWRQRLSAFVDSPQYDALMSAAKLMANFGNTEYLKHYRETEKKKAEEAQKKNEEAMKMQKDLLDIALKQQDLTLKQRELEPLSEKALRTPSKDGNYYVHEDPYTKEKIWAPTPGTEVYRTRQTEIQNALGAIVEENNIIDGMLRDIDTAFEKVNKAFATGAISDITAWFANTDATKLRSVVENIKGSGIVQKITELRSKYGSIFGQFTEGEHGFVASLLQYLNPRGDAKDLVRGLLRLQQALYRTKHKLLQHGMPSAEREMRRNNMESVIKGSVNYGAMMDYYSRPTYFAGLPILTKQQAAQMDLSLYGGRYIDLSDHQKYLSAGPKNITMPPVRRKQQ